MKPGDHPLVVLGHPNSEHVRMEFVQRTHPTATDYWDGNWVAVRVRVRVGGFDGRADGDLRAGELLGFREQLGRLHSTLRGEAVFETMEEWLSVRLTGDGLGHIEAKGFLLDRPGIGNRLDFTLKLDQTDLPNTIRGLDDACRRYPVIGNP